MFFETAFFISRLAKITQSRKRKISEMILDFDLLVTELNFIIQRNIFVVQCIKAQNKFTKPPRLLEHNKFKVKATYKFAQSNFRLMAGGNNGRR